MSTQQPNDTIVVERDESTTEYNATVYTESSRATGKQRWVANAWARGDLPTHNDGVLYTSTHNFKGHQYPAGHGKLVHYSTLTAYRSRHQVVVLNSQDYAHGFATVTYPHEAECPNKQAYMLPLTKMTAHGVHCPALAHITMVDEGSDADSQGYDKLVVFDVAHNDDYPRDEVAFRASRDMFDEQPLTNDDVRKYLDCIHGGDNDY